MSAVVYPLLHRECGKPALYLTERPLASDPVRVQIVRGLDGRRFLVSDSPPPCGSCGLTLHLDDLDVRRVGTGVPAPFDPTA